MENTLIQFRVPEELKRKLTLIAESKGISLTTLLKMYAFELSNTLYDEEALEDYESAGEIAQDLKNSLESSDYVEADSLKDFISE